MTDKTMTLDYYDAGLLGDGGGGDVSWWQDYIRSELARAHEFYQDQVDAITRHLSQPAERGEAQEKSTNYVSGRVDSTGKFHATAQEKAEPVAMPEDADTAVLMVGIGLDWLKWNAPERLKELPAAERVRVPDWRHIANEFADATCNGIQWLKNVRDGVSSADDAIAEMTENYHRIQALSAAPEADHHV